MVCFSPCHCCSSTWFLCSVSSLGQHLPTTVIMQIVKLEWEEQMINTNSSYRLMRCFFFQSLWFFFVLYVCLCDEWYNSEQFKVYFGEDWKNLHVVKTSSSLYPFLTCSSLTFTLTLKNILLVRALKLHVTTSLSKYSHTFILGLSKPFICESCRKTSSHHTVTLSLATAQRLFCSPPMIRWLVHPQDVRAFSCGVTAACACLSCGRRWLQIGGGCCQMMAPGGAMWEWSGGGRNKERRKEEEDRSLYTTNSAPFPL